MPKHVVLTRSQLANTCISILLLSLIGLLFLDAVSLITSKGTMIFSELLPFSIPFMPTTFLGGMLGIVFSTGLYFIWLEFGMDKIHCFFRKYEFWQKPVFDITLNKSHS